VAQVTIYVPDPVAKRLRAAARRAQKSVSAYIVDRLEQRDPHAAWPEGFAELFGSCQGDLPEVEDLPADEAPEL
jgi:hypothetical protein